MKKLMTSLLAVLLFGIGLCWADATVTGSVTCVPSGNGQPDAMGLTGTVVLWQNNEATTHTATLNSGSYTISDVPAGTYTAKFSGNYQGKDCEGDNRCIINEGETDVTCNIVAQIKAGDGTITMKVQAGYYYDYYGSQYFKAVDNASVTVSKDGSEIATKTTTDYPPTAAFEGITAGETYTVSVTASGYKPKTETVQGAEDVKIEIEEAFTTVSGTLKLGEADWTLPEGMSLFIRSNGKNYTAETTASGYTVNCKPGEAKAAIKDENSNNNYSYDLSENLAYNYTVTTPENGAFTITEGETFTQNIVVTKTAANVSVKTDPEDKLYPTELALIPEEGQPIYAKTAATDGTITFMGVPAGTYTLKVDRFGSKIKGSVPVVTVAATCEDVALQNAIELEDAPEVVTISGVAAYKDKVNNDADVFLKDAVVKLYAAEYDDASYGYVKVGEPLDTTTVGADGKFAFTQTLTEETTFIVTLTHKDVLPAEKSVNVYTNNDARNAVDFNIPVIWISGNVTNADALVGEVSLKCTTPDGKTYLRNDDPSYYVDFNNAQYDQANGKYYVYANGVAPIAGTFNLQLSGRDGDGFVMEVNEEATIANGAATKDLTAVKNEDKGYMTVHLRYTNVEGTALPVKSTSLYLKPNDGEADYKMTDNNGDAQFLVEKDKVYTAYTQYLNYQGYNDAMEENIPAFATDGQGKLRPNEVTVTLTGTEAQTIKISGTIEDSAWHNMGTDVKIGIQTLRDLKVLEANIVNGHYEFEAVPVATSGNMPVFLIQTDAKLSEYGVTVPYNYTIEPATIYVSTYSLADMEQNFTIYKKGCDVSGTVTPEAATGTATLTEKGRTVAAYSAKIAGGTYLFRGVSGGQYTLTVKCTGYEDATADVTVAAELADVTVPAVSLTVKAETITVMGNLSAYNKATHETFDGAKLEIWNGTDTEKLAEATVASGSNGHIPDGFTFTATMGTKVIFKMTHERIENVSKAYIVNGEYLQINPSDLGYVFKNEGDDFVVPTGFKAEWNADGKLALSWAWPADAAGKVTRVALSRKLTSETSTSYVMLKYWDGGELPVAFTDTVTQELSYTYMFSLRYANGAPNHDIAFTADMRSGEHYTLAYTVNDGKMGVISSYAQPEGHYMEGDMITVTAVANNGYKFVKFLMNDRELTEAERAKLTLYGVDKDSAAILAFSMPAEDLTVQAVFASKNAEQYTVTLVSNNEAWGTVEGAGTFDEGTEITVKATVTDEAKYEFVAWMDGETEVSKEAAYKFTVEKDITLTAVFKEKTANEKLESAKWIVFAEDGAIVINGLNGDRYDIYDLNGRLAGQALCTGAEIRLSVAASKLYIVRRLGADGSFDAKKVVVR